MSGFTFAETFHPEDASNHVCPQNSGNNTAWETAFQEARDDIPWAIAVVAVDEDLEQPSPPSPVAVTTTTTTTEQPQVDQAIKKDQKVGNGCFYFEGVMGVTLTIAAVTATFVIELLAAIFYCLAAGTHFSASDQELHMCIRVGLLVVVQFLMIADAILLTTNVLVTEVLGIVTCIITSLCGCNFQAGDAWRLYVRKVCHLTRWAFRSFHNGWAPERIYPSAIEQRMPSSQQPEEQQQIEMQQVEIDPEVNHPPSTVPIEEEAIQFAEVVVES